MRNLFTLLFCVSCVHLANAQYISINNFYWMYYNQYKYQELYQGKLKSLVNKNGKIELNIEVDNLGCAGTSCGGNPPHKYNGTQKITLIPNKKITPSEIKYLSYELYKTELHDRYFIQDDSSLINDTIINNEFCYTNWGCNTYNYFNAIESYFDKDSNYNYIGYLVSNVSDIPNRIIYIKTDHKFRDTILYGTDLIIKNIVQPNKTINYNILETQNFLINNPTFIRSSCGITNTNDNQNLVIFPKDSFMFSDGFYDWEYSNLYVSKIDSLNHITYNKKIFSDFQTDSTFIRSLKNNFIKDEFGIYAIGIAQIANKNSFFVNNQNNIDFYYKLNFTKNGILTSIDTFSQNVYDSYFIDKKDYVTYQNLTDSTTTIKYYNIQGDTIKEVYIQAVFNHELVMTNDHKYIKVDLVNNNESNLGILVYELFDSTGRKLKHYETVSDVQYYDVQYIKQYKYFVTIDSFNNIYFAFTRFDERCSGCPNHTDYQCYVFNQNIINQLSGKITNDINNNCQKDTNEASIKNILVELQLHNKSYYTLSDDSGNYKFTPYDTGHAKVILHLNNQTVFISACNDTFDVIISDTLENPIVNFLLHEPNCNTYTPKVTVDISTPFLRRCFDNVYTLSLTNESNDTAFNTYVDIELDNDLIAVDTAFLSAQNLGNNTYRFNVGTLQPLQNSRKNLIVNVRCDSTIFGQTHCVKASSFPYINCNITDAKYMQAIASCRNDSVIFTIKNIGYPEIFQQDYRIIADDSIVDVGTLNFTPSFSTNVLSYYNPEGKTYRLETRQYPIFIGEDTVLSVNIEGCGNTLFSTGYITQYTQDDDAPNVSIDCHQNVGSFDPNDKSAQPVGYGNQHLIENTNDIVYTIHFQNLGTYYASYVTIIDTLSPDFDITTLKIISSSHDYTVSIVDSNILKFSFQNINLIDAATDSLLSNGFIKFSIKPKLNTSIGKKISNNAFITFDYNEAIQTNTVHHEIGKDFLKAAIISITKNSLFKNINIKVYPNPASKQITLEITKDIPKNGSLHFYTLDGNEIYVQKGITNFNQIYVESWSKGLYLFEIKSNNIIIQSGKIIIQ